MISDDSGPEKIVVDIIRGIDLSNTTPEEAVNILGSLFYGTILGIFLVAFYVKHVQSQAVFIAACIAEIFIIIAWHMDMMAFLWLNVLGCILVVGIAIILQMVLPQKKVAIE